MNKKDLSERDICTKFITPAIQKAGWDINNQMREEYTFTDGRVIVRGNLTTRGKSKRADYLLSYKANLPIAIVEAKDNKHTIGAGLQQAINYGDILQVPFVYSSNGDGFMEHDRLTGAERELGLDEFPSPEELWQRYKGENDITDEQAQLLTEPYHFTSGAKRPRYYQLNAINRTIEAIAKGQRRVLLVMATGTGKTFTAFQIMWRLKKSGVAKKILFLADRNILVDQTIDNDFKPFQNVITKVQNRKLDSSYEVYMALYQQLTSGNSEEDVFKQFSPDFFDLIIVDECHRGSAKEESNWRRVLNYFDSAIQIGLTATPKETKDTSNIAYFGDPVYTYSLKQGIDDGFLAPYKVIRISIDRDLEGYRPTKGEYDKYGYLIEDREYNLTDFDKTLVLEKRTELVAKKVSEFLKKTDRFAKTIVFCTDIDHAERMRQALVNENKDLVAQDSRYVMQITGDNKEGKAQLDNFIDVESLYPTIVTTSKLLTTGVDCKTCKLIVLDANIGSMTEFKQIIGRGTRLNPDYGKEYFTIMDFRNNSRKFADPDFDGDPVQVLESNDGNLPNFNETNTGDTDRGAESNENSGNGEIDEQPRKYYVKNADVCVLNERVQYYDQDGKLITESLKDYSRKNILKEYDNLDAFLIKWNSELKKEAIINELVEHGVLLDALREEVGEAAKDLDDFDLICHIAYDQKPLTRSERAKKVKQSHYFEQYSDVAKKVIEALIDKYANDGIKDFDDVKILKLEPFTEFGNPMKIAKEFGGKVKYFEAIKELEKHLYA